jgi:hypothetical protein
MTMTVQSMAPKGLTPLTHEEESYLKTALAIVVVKRRLAAAAFNKTNTTTSSSNHEAVPGEPHDGNVDDVASKTILSSASSSPLDRLFESTSNSSFLLKQADPNHLKSIFQMAVTLAAFYTTKHHARNNDSTTSPLSGIVSHLAHQLDLQDDLNIQNWIRDTLTTCESTARVLAVSKVLQTLLEEQHASPDIIAVTLLVVSILLKELYHGETPRVFNSHLLCVQLLAILEKAALSCGDGSAFLEILEQVFGNLLVPTPTQDISFFYYEENARGGLDAGAKLLIKIGLYRILNQVSAAAL